MRGWLLGRWGTGAALAIWICASSDGASRAWGWENGDFENKGRFNVQVPGWEVSSSRPQGGRADIVGAREIMHSNGLLAVPREGKRALQVFAGTPVGAASYPLWFEVHQQDRAPSGRRMRARLWFAALLSAEGGAVPDGKDPRAVVSLAVEGHPRLEHEMRPKLPCQPGSVLGELFGRGWVDGLWQYWVFPWRRMESARVGAGTAATVRARVEGGAAADRFSQESFVFMDDVEWVE